MLSKSAFDLDSSNNPVIMVEAVSSGDVRDKIARRFVETFAHGSSQWCEILPSGESQFLIFPLKPEHLRQAAERMLEKADEWDAQTKKFAALVEKG
jgi:hypothetical protein